MSSDGVYRTEMGGATLLLLNVQRTNLNTFFIFVTYATSVYIFNILCGYVLFVCKYTTILYECFDLQMCIVVNRSHGFVCASINK